MDSQTQEVMISTEHWNAEEQVKFADLVLEDSWTEGVRISTGCLNSAEVQPADLAHAESQLQEAMISTENGIPPPHRLGRQSPEPWQ